uniref:Uncharacterized protein n=1 Tax=Tanacetum cinerariifolium TaxID=118510 RepID=A0A699GKT4_TANCI|nr:hypothetical protein [Tanacetum cinerariifolium]
MCFELDDEDADDDEDKADDYDHKVLPKVTFWFDRHKYKFVHGVEIRPNISTRGESDDLDLCSICLQPWTMDKVHQMSPSGEIAKDRTVN